MRFSLFRSFILSFFLSFADVWKFGYSLLDNRNGEIPSERKKGTSKRERGKDGLAETIKSRDQISARVSSGKCIPCSGRERYNVWIIKRAGSRPGGIEIQPDSISRPSMTIRRYILFEEERQRDLLSSWYNFFATERDRLVARTSYGRAIDTICRFSFYPTEGEKEKRNSFSRHGTNGENVDDEI